MDAVGIHIHSPNHLKLTQTDIHVSSPFSSLHFTYAEIPKLNKQREERFSGFSFHKSLHQPDKVIFALVTKAAEQ